MNWQRIGILLAVVILFPILALAVLSALSRRPENLGARDGALAPCPDRPNCVSSTATTESQRVDPLNFDGDAAAAMQRLADIVGAFPRVRIVAQTKTYLHAEFTSATFRFIDDVEFLAHPAEGRIDVRSASRVGHSDLGVNRRRVEAIRDRYGH